jgi:hypothetical protein
MPWQTLIFMGSLFLHVGSLSVSSFDVFGRGVENSRLSTDAMANSVMRALWLRREPRIPPLGGVDGLTHLPGGGEVQIEIGAPTLSSDERECGIEAALK